jgi:hypothetical protein
MTDDREMRVYVLGAGCSYDAAHGYPLAKDFVPALNAYAAKISAVPECQRIKQAVEDTAALLTACQTGTCHASTIDQLINLIWNNRCDDQLKALNIQPGADKTALRYSAVRKAKVATAACFLDKEGPALKQQIGKYKEFIQRKVLNETGPSVPSQARLVNSSARVLTFNYDRLFELAFFGGFADEYLRRFSPYQAEALNSGLNALGGVGEFAKDRFCFLKLHGSTGVICCEDPWEQETRHLRDVRDWKEENITDALFFPTKPDPHFVAEPMIIFPYEKDFVVSGRDNKLPFRDYITRVWAQASYVLQEASEIWVIGYSFDPMDCMYLVDRLRQAEKCERIVIQNVPASECDRLEALLTVEYGLTIPIKKYPVPF